MSCENSIGEKTWKVDDFLRLRRFLCFGAENGTMYIEAKDIGRENAQSIMRLIEEGKGNEVIQVIKEFSEEGRATKQEPVLLALAMCAKLAEDVKIKQAAFSALSDVCRIPTYLFTFVSLVYSLCEADKSKGWGRMQRTAISNWYNDKEPLHLAMQVTKYIQRGGWSHVDLLRLAHVKPKNDAIAAVFRYMTKGMKSAKEDFGKESAADETKAVIKYLEAVYAVKHTTDEQEAARLIEQHSLAWEHVPTPLFKSQEVWTALLNHMPLQAMLRHLGRLTAVGLLKPMSAQAKTVIDKLRNEDELRKSRLHPFNLLVAVKTYSSGKGEKGKTKWQANNNIVEALNHAFISSFKNVAATDKRYLIAIDVSKSMQYAGVNGCPQVSPVTCAGAVAMTIARTEKQYQLMTISGNTIKEVALRPDLPLQNITVGVLGASEKARSGPTDCSLPITDALRKKKAVDVFIIFTDSENMSPESKPCESLIKYRKEMEIPDARLVVCALTSNAFSIADPDDPGMLDIVGFDPNVPQVIRQFVCGQV